MEEKVLVKKDKSPLVPTRHQNKIEKYGLEEIVVDGVFNKKYTLGQIANRCNAELSKRGSGHLKINKSNVRTYVRKIQTKLSKLDQEFYQTVIENAGVVDKVKNLSSLVTNAHRRGEAITEDMVECYERGDKDGFYRAAKAAQSNDHLISDIVNKLANLEGKLQTCVTMDFVLSLVKKFMEIVHAYDGIDGLSKEHLIVKMSEAVDFG